MKHTISVCSIIVFIFSLLKYGAQIFSAEPFDWMRMEVSPLPKEQHQSTYSLFIPTRHLPSVVLQNLNCSKLMTFNILNIFAGQPYARWLIYLKNIALASVRPRERTQYIFWQQSLQQVLPLKSLLWSSENTKNELWWLNWDAVTACAGLVGLGLRGNYLFFLVQLFCPICSNLDVGYLKVILIPGKKTCVFSMSRVDGCWEGSCHFGGWQSHVCKISVS